MHPICVTDVGKTIERSVEYLTMYRTMHLTTGQRSLFIDKDRISHLGIQYLTIH